MISVNGIVSSNLIMLFIYPGAKVLIKKGFIIIAIFLSVRYPVLRTQFLVNPKYCSGFTLQYLNVAVLYNLASC